jgi:hypothetical protein
LTIALLLALLPQNERVHHGALTWILTLLALSSAAWAVRDFLAWLRLRRTA